MQPDTAKAPRGDSWFVEGRDKQTKPQQPSAFVVAHAQLLLIDLGYRPGATDGVLDVHTEAAVRAFQIDQQTRPDGRVDAALLAELEVAHQALTVRRAQARLWALGYQPGPIDGTLGPRTRAAISVYERERGYPITGEVTALLMQRLQSEQSALSEPKASGAFPFASGLSGDSRATETDDRHVNSDGEAVVADGVMGDTLQSAEPADVEAAYDPTWITSEEDRLLSAAQTSPAAGPHGMSGTSPDSRAVAALPSIAVDRLHGYDSETDRRLGQGDRVRLTVGIEGADIIEREIDRNGRIDLPGGLSVRAAGLTLAELKRSITSKLVESYLNKLSVDVSRPPDTEAEGS